MKWNQPTNNGKETTYIGEHRGIVAKVVIENVILTVKPSFVAMEKNLAQKSIDDYLDNGIVREGRFGLNGNQIPNPAIN